MGVADLKNILINIIKHKLSTFTISRAVKQRNCKSIWYFDIGQQWTLKGFQRGRDFKFTLTYERHSTCMHCGTGSKKRFSANSALKAFLHIANVKGDVKIFRPSFVWLHEISRMFVIRKTSNDSQMSFFLSFFNAEESALSFILHERHV